MCSCLSKGFEIKDSLNKHCFAVACYKVKVKKKKMKDMILDFTY